MASLNIHLPCTKIDIVNGMTNVAVKTSAIDKATKNMFVTVRSLGFLTMTPMMSRFPKNAVMITSIMKLDSKAISPLLLFRKSFESRSKFSLSIVLAKMDDEVVGA